MRNFNNEFHRSGDPRMLLTRAEDSVSPSFLSHTSTRPSPIFSAPSPNIEGWSFAHSTPFIGAPLSPNTSRAFSGNGLRQVGEQANSPSWSEHDFPPLLDKQPERRFHFSGDTDTRRWGDRDMHEDGIDDLDAAFTSARSESSLPLKSATPCTEENNSLQAISDVDLVQSFTGSCGTSGDGDGLAGDAIPLTPGFSLSPITPLTPKTSGNFPRTPSTASSVPASDVNFNEIPRSQMAPFGTPQNSAKYGSDGDGVREFDPSTIFVGGLEMFGPNAWDETKLRRLFERYGSIETIQLVRPGQLVT